jgi:hypothetical protein
MWCAWVPTMPMARADLVVEPTLELRTGRICQPARRDNRSKHMYAKGLTPFSAFCFTPHLNGWGPTAHVRYHAHWIAPNIIRIIMKYISILYVFHVVRILGWSLFFWLLGKLICITLWNRGGVYLVSTKLPTQRWIKSFPSYRAKSLETYCHLVPSN